jgi:hypothetical protein
MVTHEHHNPKDDEAIAQKHLEEQAAVHRHQRRQDVNLDVSLAALLPLVGNVASLLEIGVPVDDLTDKVSSQLAWSDPDAVDTLAKVLTGAHKHVRKTHDDRVKADEARTKAEAKAEDEQHKADGA